MIQPPRRIDANDSVHRFSCGRPALDEWLIHHALRAERERTATTYVAIAGGHIAAYYSLAAHSVVRATIGGGRLARNAPDPVPALLLARLAVDQAWQGQHLGSDMLGHAVRVARTAGGLIGLRALIVDPINEDAVTFYSCYGFRPFPAQPARMFYPL